MGESGRIQAVRVSSNEYESVDIHLDDNDEDVLLDWEQYARHRRGVECCGVQCECLASVLPCAAWSTPMWWYQLSRRQRQVVKCAALVAAVIVSAVVLAIVLTVVSLLRPSASGMAALPSPPAPTPPAPAASPPPASPPPPPPTVPPACEWSAYRLPVNIRPTVYHLEMAVDLDSYAVTGHLDLETDVTGAPTACLVLHSDESITMDSVAAEIPSGVKIPGSVQVVNATLDGQMIVRFDQMFDPGPVRFHFHFHYPLSEGLAGFYRSTFTGPDNLEHSLATTQFEVMNARKAFPCFDEPNMKAKFNITLITPSGATALANAAELSHTQPVPGGPVTHVFELTPPMSTYLVAFVVGNLTAITGKYTTLSGRDVPVSIWSVPTRVAESKSFALRAATLAMTGLESLLKVEYPLSKLDLVAIPDFAAGAMENWGLVTFREIDLLVPDQFANASVNQLYTVPAVVAHELSHMWFGDLVTTDWWSELWLNEGFATYFENVGAGFSFQPSAPLPLTDALLPVNYMRNFHADFASSALQADAQDSAHALSLPPAAIQSVDASETLFDSITYDKGGSVLRMLHAYLDRAELSTIVNTAEDTNWQLRRRLLADGGADPFLEGLRQYLQTHQMSTATADTLWHHMEVATSQPVKQWMQSWTYQQGVPLVTVEKTATGFNLTQMQYTSSRGQVGLQCGGAAPVLGYEPGVNLGSQTAPRSPWWIPLAWRISGSPAVNWTEFTGCVQSVGLNSSQASSTQPILANVGRYGLFRVNYSPQLWTWLIRDAQIGDLNAPGFITDIDLAGLLLDAYELAKAPNVQLALMTFLDLAAAIPRRAATAKAAASHRLAWDAAAGPLSELYRGMNTVCGPKYRDFVNTRMLKAFTNATSLKLFDVSPSDSYDTRYLRSTLMALSASVPDITAQQEADQLLTRYLNGSGTLHPDIRGSIMRLAVSSGDPATWQALRTYYELSYDPGDISRALYGLAFVPIAAIDSALNLTLSDSVRSQDVASFLRSIASKSAAATDKAWEFVKTNFDRLAIKGGGTQHDQRVYAGGCAAAVASYFHTAQQQAAMMAFFSAKFSQPDVIGRLTNNAKDSIAQNIVLTQTLIPATCRWLV